jgi:hypothetical protein
MCSRSGWTKIKPLGFLWLRFQDLSAFPEVVLGQMVAWIGKKKANFAGFWPSGNY